MTQTSTRENARIYEVGFNILPTVGADNVDKVVQGIREEITRVGGSLIAEGAPQELKLAYTMYVNNAGKNTPYTHAYFGWIKFETTEPVLELDLSLKGNRQILRHILFRTVREDTRANIKLVRDVKRTETLKTTKKVDEVVAEVSEERLDEALEGITGEAKE